MNSHVVYFSKTGHSKKIANAIAQGLNVTATDLKEESPALTNSDLLFLVTGIYASKCAPEVLRFVENLQPEAVGRVCLVTSSAGKTPATELRSALERRGIKVARDEYISRGSFLIFGMGHPNAQELSGAADFAVKLSQKPL